MTNPTINQKRSWQGEVISVQPRIRLSRSFDERSHSYLGYVLRLRGTLDGEAKEFVVAVGKGAHEKHQFSAGDQISGQSVSVSDARLEIADVYKTSALKIIARSKEAAGEPPPYLGVPPPLEVYRERGHRRLAAVTYATKCLTCVWGCEMPVEMILDHWNPSVRRYRREAFCYGPKICPIYKSGPTRKVPGRGSSAESVGDFWFRQVTQRVVQGDFEASIGPKAIRLSGSQFGLVV